MKKAIKKILKIVAGGVIILLLLIVLSIFLLRIPTFQNYITHKAVSFVSSKTHTRIELRKFYLAFPKSIVIEDLFVEDTSHDTLLCLSKLKVDINMLALLKKKVEVNRLLLSGVNANIIRNQADSTFNFNFIVKAFAQKNNKPVDKKAPVEKSKTDTASWQIAVDELTLQNIRGGYDDRLTGTDIHGVVGYLKLKMKAIDIKALNFSGQELVLSDANAKMTVTKSTKNSIDTIRSLLPSLSLNKINLKNVGFSFENAPSGQFLLVHAGNLHAVPEKIDLNAQIIKVKSLELDTSNGVFAYRRNTDQADVSNTSITTAADKKNGWQISAGSVQLKKVDFKYDVTNLPVLASGVDYNHFYVRDIALNINNGSYSPKQITGSIKNISFAEKSGFTLKHLSAEVFYNDHGAELRSLSLLTPHTQISDHISVRYPTIKSLAQNISKLWVDINLKNTNIASRDVLLFAPALKKYPLFSTTHNTSIAINGKINGPLNNITITGLNISGEAVTSISLDAHISGLPDVANATYDIKLKDLNTSITDIQALLGNIAPSSINLPNKMSLTGTFKGSFKDLSTQLALRTSSGDADIDAGLSMLNGDTQYTASIALRHLDIGYFIKDTILGPVTANISVKGQNIRPETLTAQAAVEIQSIRFSKYDYSNISINANADHNRYNAGVSVKDKNLLMDLNAMVSLSGEEDSIQALLNLQGADLQKLNLLDGNIRVSGKMNTDINGKPENPNGHITLTDVTIIKSMDTYHLGNFLVASLNDKKHSVASIKSGIINANYQGTMQLSALAGTLKSYLNNYFHIDSTNAATTKDTAEQNFDLAINVLPNPVISVLLPGVERFDGADIKAGFNSNKQQLDMTASLPGLAYKNNSLENLHLAVNSNAKAMDYSLAFDRFSNGNIHFAQTILDGSIQHDSIDFALRIHEVDSANKLIVSGSMARNILGAYIVRLDNKRFVLANKKWKLPDDNYVSFAHNGFYVHDLDLSYQDQQLSVHSEKDDPSSPLQIEFKKFELGTLSQIIENDTSLIRGLLNGSVELRNLQHAVAFVSDVRIDSLSYKQNPIGNIQLRADNLSPGKYSAFLSIGGADNDVKLDGYYAATGNSNQLNFKVDINKLQLRSIEGFTGGQLRESSGYITGSLGVTGPGNSPIFNGEIGFKDASVNIAYINNKLSFTNDRVRIDGKGVYFNSFNIHDPSGQKAVINGSVYTTDFHKMKFDLSLTTDHFTVMNTDIKDNPLFFGHVVLSSNLSIKGDKSLPVIRANAKLLSGSNFTVVIPSSKISVNRGEGIVELVDTSTKNNIMKQTDTLPIDAGFKGIDLAVNLDVNKETSFKLIVDKTSGDSLVVKGDGQLSFSMDPTGKQNLTGSYVLSSGSYNASFQKVITRQFKIKEGSSITWNGSPTDASVDLTATYTVRASPADLLSTELAGATSGERNVYHQLLNFIVLMNMKGTLLTPIITFQLDMADQDKNAFGGTVYSKINSLNTDDPDDLNKQVFALLVLNSFMPTSLGGGSEGEPSPVNTFARNSVNEILSDELNKLSGKYIKGVDLNFGLQTNDIYSPTSVQENTLVSVGLKKEFFKSRLSVQLGTSINVQNNNGTITQTNSGNIGGDFDIEYKLTRDGRYKLKAFRDSEYDFIDGLLYRTGGGFVFTRDYDTLKQLFAHPEKEKTSN